MAAPAFDGTTAVDDIVAYVDAIRRRPMRRDELVGLLAEQSPLYAGRGTGEAERLRGYLMASFETTGLPAAALPYVLEELETGRNPYTVAAAARALRGAVAPPDRVVALLVRAIERLRSSDDGVCFERYEPSARPAPTTALTELLRTIAQVGPPAALAREALQAMRDDGAFSPAVKNQIELTLSAVLQLGPAERSCCESLSVPAAVSGQPAAVSKPDLKELELQDQDGARLKWRDFFSDRPSVLTFFYTRCMNPDKCSLTITNLARLQKRIAEQGLRGRVRLAAISYDPAYDLPERLRVYGADRGMAFDADNRLLRTTTAFEPLRQFFDLGVGYGSVTVNRHRLELFILDAAGVVAADFTRALWEEDEVLAMVRSCIGDAPPFADPQARMGAHR